MYTTQIQLEVSQQFILALHCHVEQVRFVYVALAISCVFHSFGI